MLDPMTTAETSVSLPTPAPAKPGPVCCECGQPFKRVRPHQQFCSTAHAKSFQNRQLTEGRAIAALAKAWRAGRNLGKNADPVKQQVARDALAELCAILDGFNLADRQAGRPNPLVYAEGLLKAGRYIDRQRSR
jgi:hypothetical protein